MARPVGSLPSAGKSSTKMLSAGTPQLSDATDVSNGSGSSAANISSENGSSPRSTPDLVLWRFWDAGYERSYHGAPAIVDLGEI
ncbi:MAG: hypothetical protein WCC97_18095 [Candidatus Acidiferrales bacterium]